jgi:hypothetical protein
VHYIPPEAGSAENQVRAAAFQNQRLQDEAARVVRVWRLVPTKDCPVFAATVTALVAQAAAVRLQIPITSPSISDVDGGMVIVMTDPFVTLKAKIPPVTIPDEFTVVWATGFAPIVNEALGKVVK